MVIPDTGQILNFVQIKSLETMSEKLSNDDRLSQPGSGLGYTKLLT
jgi:hypothetical protein